MAENSINTETPDEIPALEPTPADLTRYQIGLATTAQLVERSRQADGLFAEHASRTKAAEDALARRLDLEHRQLDAVSKTFTSEQLRQARQQTNAAALREIKENTDKRRWETLRGLVAIEQQIGVVAEMFQSPAHILARHALGSEERSRYLEQVRTAGPVAIGNYAKHAAATMDKTLGAVIMDRLDAMNASDRKQTGVNRQQLAQVLAGEEYNAAQAAIQRVRQRFNEAMVRNRAFESGKKKIAPHERIGLGLGRPAERRGEIDGDGDASG